MAKRFRILQIYLNSKIIETKMDDNFKVAKNEESFKYHRDDWLVEVIFFSAWGKIKIRGIKNPQ